MSFFDSLTTSVAGVSAQSNRLSTIGTNISNVNTTGYKASTVAFQQVLGNDPVPSYRAGGVHSIARFANAAQGVINATTSTTDLAINGKGYFAVKATDGTTVLTRAGSFVQDANGNLVNTAGNTLLGYSLPGGTALVPVSIPTDANVSVASNGTVTVTDASGTAKALYQVPLANVMSPDKLTSLDGDTFQVSADSGAMTLATAGTGALGSITSSSLEGSTVDLATELANMITTQRAYEANSKVMTASSELLTKLTDTSL